MTNSILFPNTKYGRVGLSYNGPRRQYSLTNQVMNGKSLHLLNMCKVHKVKSKNFGHCRDLREFQCFFL